MGKYLDLNWEDYLADCGEDVDKIWTKFKDKLNEGMRLYIPLRTNHGHFKRPIDKELKKK